MLPRPNTSTVVTDPIVVFEILSPSTSSTDRIEKHEEYRATPSIQRYVILEQDRIAATVFARAGGDWIGHVFLDGAILAMPEIGIDVPLAGMFPRAEPALAIPAKAASRPAKSAAKTHRPKLIAQNSSPKTHRPKHIAQNTSPM